MRERSKAIFNNRGSSSVLVLFLTIVLVTYGAFSIASANVNIKFSIKALEWNSHYYELDSDGQYLLRYADDALSKAENQAIEYLCSFGFANESYEGIPSDLQSAAAKLYEAGKGSEEAVLDILNMIYFYYAKKELVAGQESLYFALAERKGSDWISPEFRILPLADGNIVREITVESIFYSIGDKDYHLTVKLSVTPVKYDIQIVKDAISGLKSDESSNFIVKEWRQWQTPQE